jgi:acyl dehydratase
MVPRFPPLILSMPAPERNLRMQFGRYYEEFEVGAVYKHWPGKTVTEYDDHLFCLLTMNHHPLHMDLNYAEKTTDFGRNVVVGNYIYSLLLGMSVPDVSGKAIANLEISSLRHVAPTFHGDTIYGETTVLDKTESKSKDDRGIVEVETIGYKQDGTVVCIFRRKVMVPKRSYGESRGDRGRADARRVRRVVGDHVQGAAGGEQAGQPGHDVGVGQQPADGVPALRPRVGEVGAHGQQRRLGEVRQQGGDVGVQDPDPVAVPRGGHGVQRAQDARLVHLHAQHTRGRPLLRRGQ